MTDASCLRFFTGAIGFRTTSPGVAKNCSGPSSIRRLRRPGKLVVASSSTSISLSTVVIRFALSVRDGCTRRLGAWLALLVRDGCWTA